jgi:CheY-like chemotaxis protein
MSDAGAYRVLLVDDDLMLRECLSILLADYHMPGMSGLELYQAAGAHDAASRPHFVLLTGNANESLTRGSRSGVVSCSSLRRTK